VRLARLVIRNFKALREVELVMPKQAEGRPGSAGFLSLVGENNTGKSSVLEALSLVCPGQELTTPTVDHFPGRAAEPEQPIEIELEFEDLTPADREQHAIRAHVHDGKYRIKKRWERPETKKYEGWAYGPQYTFPTMPEKTNRKALVDAGPDWAALVEAFETDLGNTPTYTPKTLERLQEFAIRTESPVAVEGEPGWSKHPGGFNAMLDTVLPRVIFIHAIRETKEEVASAKKESTIRKIVSVLFERYLAASPAVRGFRTAAEGVKRLFDEKLKDRFVDRLERALTSKLNRLIDIHAYLDFEPPDVTADLASKTELWIQDGADRVRPEHQGHGAQRAIILTLLEQLAEQGLAEEGDGYTRPLLLLVEEPEIYMHPEMCRKMRDVLLNIARSGTAQVICSTHSPVFLDLADRHDGIAIFSKSPGGRIETRQRTDDLFGGDDAKEQRDRLRMILNFDPTANEVFFAKEVCLVEGDCEVASLDAIAERLRNLGEIDWGRYLLARRQLSLVNCRGKWTIRAFQRVLNAFGIPYRVIHDRDKERFTEGANGAILGLLDGEEARRLVHTPNFEEHIFKRHWQKDKPWKAVSAIRDLAEVSDDLLGFFEFALGATTADLSAEERDAEPAGGDAPGALALAEMAIPPRRLNLRDELPRVPVDHARLVASTRQPGVLSLSAGACRVPELAEEGVLPEGTNAPARYLARVRGESMADTLLDGDQILLEALENVRLDPIEGDHEPVPLATFKEQVHPDGIYVVAMNEDISYQAYTLKRVRFEEHGDGEWYCFMSADNPDVDWGERGLVVVRPTDQVHFAAKVVGLTAEGDQ